MSCFINISYHLPSQKKKKKINKKNSNESLYIKTIILFGSPLNHPFLFYLIISSLLCFTSPSFLSPKPSHSIVSPLVLCYTIFFFGSLLLHFSLSLSSLLHHSIALSPLCSHLHHSIKISLFGCGGRRHSWWLDWVCHRRRQYGFVWLRSLGLLGCVVMGLSRLWR